MRILHICNDFSYSQVHSCLYRELDKIGVTQTVYSFYGGEDRTGKNQYDSNGTDFIYKNILKPSHRIFFHKKVKITYCELLNSINPQEYQLCHAISLFTNGALAYKLYKKYGIPYVVAIRNTDINVFLRYEPHTWSLGLKILLHAEKIVFISKALMEQFRHHVIIRCILKKIEPKFILQPNGIDDYWIEHVKKDKKAIYNHQIIYVGRFDTNKNVVRLIKSVLSLNKEYPDIMLHLVGGGDVWENKVLKMVANNPQFLMFHGKVYDKNELKGLYNQCSIFAMPSIYETFGLVYLEALSQDLAIIFTEHQGVDGLLDDRVGEKVNAFSKKSIAMAISKIFENRQYYLSSEVINFEVFRWSDIARRYFDIFSQIVDIRSNG